MDLQEMTKEQVTTEVNRLLEEDRADELNDSSSAVVGAITLSVIIAAAFILVPFVSYWTT